jgi:hypothetical protein
MNIMAVCSDIERHYVCESPERAGSCLVYTLAWSEVEHNMQNVIFTIGSYLFFYDWEEDTINDYPCWQTKVTTKMGLEPTTSVCLPMLFRVSRRTTHYQLRHSADVKIDT